MVKGFQNHRRSLVTGIRAAETLWGNWHLLARAGALAVQGAWTLAATGLRRAWDCLVLGRGLPKAHMLSQVLGRGLRKALCSGWAVQSRAPDLQVLPMGLLSCSKSTKHILSSLTCIAQPYLHQERHVVALHIHDVQGGLSNTARKFYFHSIMKWLLRARQTLLTSSYHLTSTGLTGRSGRPASAAYIQNPNI